MRKLFFFAMLLGLLLSARVEAFSLTRNLELGSYGSDVRELQVFLNQNSETQLAVLGPGSKGKETGYFGAYTRTAVKKFQEKYAASILIPEGLTKGNGQVDLYTRLEIAKQELAASSSGSQAATANPLESQNNGLMTSLQADSGADWTALASLFQTMPPAPARSKSMDILAFSPQSGPSGTEITLFGRGFSLLGNKIYTGYDVLENVPSPDGKTLKFKVNFNPLAGVNLSQATTSPVLNLPLYISVVNDSGMSNTVLFTLTK